MRKTLAVVISSLLFAAAAAFCADQAQGVKYVIMLADWGKNPPPKDVIRAMSRNQELRLAFAWHSGLKLPEEMKPLLKEKRAELALSFEDEPVMPLIYNTVISTPVAINFSWPEDVWDMVVRAKEDLFSNTQVRIKGMYLRSGVFSDKLVPGLKRLGIFWTNIGDEPDAMRGVYIKDGFLVLSTKKKDFSTAAECWRWINSRKEDFVVLDFGSSGALDGEFLDALAANIRQGGSVKAVTPEVVLAKLKEKVPELGDRPLDASISSWTRLPLVWYELGIVRKTIENYKNSGTAKLETLEKLREQLYSLYSYKLIENLKNSPSQENLDAFQKKIEAIYRILNLPVDESLKTLPGLELLRPFSVETSTESLVIMNSESALPGKKINTFAVTLAPETVTFFVDLDTSAVQAPLIVDIYMDLNNQEGAGLTRLLPGLNSYTEVNDAWEYALRMEKDKATLYRAGRFEPVQIKQFPMQLPWELEIPRSLLRGNPLNWGYQAVAAVKNSKDTGYDISDFLAKDDEQRGKLLGTTAPQLPAVRGQARTRAKQE